MARICIVHAYPSAALVQALLAARHELVLVVPHELELAPDAGVEIHRAHLRDDSAVLSTIETAHCANSIDVMLPIYEGSTPVTSLACDRLGLRGNIVAAARASRDKYASFERWAAVGVPTPETVPITDLADSLGAALDTLGLPMVLKPSDSMNSQGVCLVHDAASLERAASELLALVSERGDVSERDRNRIAYGRAAVPVIAQSYCPGAEVGVDLLYRGEAYCVLGTFEKAVSKGPHFAESMSISPTSLGVPAEQALASLAARAVMALGATEGAAHVEIRLAEDGTPRVLEAGLRPGGGYTADAIEALCGVHPAVELAGLLMGAPLPVSPTQRGAVLYGGVLHRSTGILRSVTGLETLTSVPGLVKHAILHRPGDYVSAPPNSAQPHYMYYLIHGHGRSEVLRSHGMIQSGLCLETEPAPPV